MLFEINGITVLIIVHILILDFLLRVGVRFNSSLFVTVILFQADRRTEFDLHRAILLSRMSKVKNVVLKHAD